MKKTMYYKKDAKPITAAGEAISYQLPDGQTSVLELFTQIFFIKSFIFSVELPLGEHVFIDLDSDYASRESIQHLQIITDAILYSRKVRAVHRSLVEEFFLEKNTISGVI